MNLLNKIFRFIRKQPHDEAADVLFPACVSARQFAAFKPKQRMQAVMIAGDSGEVQFYRFLKWCIDKDPDLDVRLAALKRLPNFLGQNDLFSYLMRLDSSAGKSVLEPYLSMALSRVGLITLDQFKERLKSG